MQSVIHLKQGTFDLFPPVYAVQNDTGRTLKMIVDDVTFSNTDTGNLYFRRSDGSYYNVTTTFDSNDNSFEADITQALTQPGITQCQLKVTDTNDLVVSSYSFVIVVQESTDGVPIQQMGITVQDLINAIHGGITDELKQALLQIAEKVAYVDDHGATYYQDLYDALYPPKTLTSITCVYTQSGTVYTTDTLDSLKTDLVVTAHFDDNTTETVAAADYTLSGSLTAGTSTITVTYDGETATFDVTVTEAIPLYVTDGLVIMLDGINNTGSGHDSTATTWKDLAGNYDVDVPSGNATWDTDGLIFSGSQNRQVKCATTPGESAATIEIVLEPGIGGDSAQVIAGFESYGSGSSSREFNYYGDGTVNCVGTSTAAYVNPAGSVSAIRTMVGTYTTGATIGKFFVNGTQATTTGSSHSIQKKDNILYLGNAYGSNTTNCFHGKIMALRYYSRVLTDEEIAQNHTADVYFYNLGT